MNGAYSTYEEIVKCRAALINDNVYIIHAISQQRSKSSDFLVVFVGVFNTSDRYYLCKNDTCSQSCGVIEVLSKDERVRFNVTPLYSSSRRK